MQQQQQQQAIMNQVAQAQSFLGNYNPLTQTALPLQFPAN